MIQKHRKGQSALEFMLYISVIVVALVALSWIAFGTSFKDGYDTMKEDVDADDKEGGTLSVHQLDEDTRSVCSSCSSHAIRSVSSMSP